MQLVLLPKDIHQGFGYELTTNSGTCEGNLPVPSSGLLAAWHSGPPPSLIRAWTHRNAIESSVGDDLQHTSEGGVEHMLNLKCHTLELLENRFSANDLSRDSKETKNPSRSTQVGSPQFTMSIMSPHWRCPPPEMPGSLNNFVMIHKLAVSTRCKDSWRQNSWGYDICELE